MRRRYPSAHASETSAPTLAHASKMRTRHGVRGLQAAGTGDRGEYLVLQEGELWEEGCYVPVHEARLPARTQVTPRWRVPRSV
jgi:hypothetical protein